MGHVVFVVRAISSWREHSREHRIDLNTLNYGADPLRWILLEKFTSLQLEGNSYGVLRCVGATEAEHQYAHEKGSRCCWDN